MLSRRSVLYAVGGAGLALVGTGSMFWSTRTPERALRAWDGIASAPPKDVRLDAFRHAILPPHPHNRQPWQIRLVGDHEALITCDLERRLPETDPFDRQILIGFGCFLEVARIAAAERGVLMEVEAFPDGVPSERLDRRPIARLRFVANNLTPKDPLFAAIATRRSNKQPFDTARPVAQFVLDVMTAQQPTGARISASRDGALIREARKLSWDAWMVEFQTERTWRESVDLMRIGRAEIEANPDGISIGGPFLETLALAGQLSRAKIGQPGTTANKTSTDRYRSIMATGMAYSWITTNANSRIEQLAAGRAYVRMNLEATRQGLGVHPISQALQEFKEMEPMFGRAHQLFGAQPGQRVQMLARLGYGNPVARTPRWPLENRLVGT